MGNRFDAFTHKPTSQYSLAYEKASIIFNISAVLSCHAANQNRSEDSGLKFAYHSFQASAGMFNYINENFLHAPSVDLSRDTVKAGGIPGKANCGWEEGWTIGEAGKSSRFSIRSGSGRRCGKCVKSHI